MLRSAQMLRFRKKSQTLRNQLTQRPKFPKLQETIWLTVINKNVKFPPHLDSSG